MGEWVLTESVVLVRVVHVKWIRVVNAAAAVTVIVVVWIWMIVLLLLLCLVGSVFVSCLCYVPRYSGCLLPPPYPTLPLTPTSPFCSFHLTIQRLRFTLPYSPSFPWRVSCYTLFMVTAIPLILLLLLLLLHQSSSNYDHLD